MQNKGFIKFFAIALGLICLFYLSFSFVARYQTDKAVKLSTVDNQLDQEKYNKYIDSISSEKVWLGYTYKEVLEREISLGLDLKGGMNVTLEISVADILKSLSNNNSDANFNKAIELAKERQVDSQRDFLTLFEQALIELDPNASLAAIFSTFETQDRITLDMSNAEVMGVLRSDVNSAIDNSFNVLRSRIDRFGVVQPNIQRLENTGRILVELPGVKEKERVRKLLQGTANLEFYETYNFQEVAGYLENLNATIRNMEAVRNTANSAAIATTTVDTAATTTTPIAEAETTSLSELDSLMAETSMDSTLIDVEQNRAAEIARWNKENPLFAVLRTNIETDLGPMQAGGALMGFTLASDTATVNSYLKQLVVPSDLRGLRFRWSVKPREFTELNGVNETKRGYFELIAIKVNSDGKAVLEGNVITDARADFNQGMGASGSVVSMTMNGEGSEVWARTTKQNIGRSIAIILDGYVYSYPNVNDEIRGGQSQITGNFTPEEARDLANVLKSGTMPAPAYIVQEDVVGPSLGQEAIDSGLRSFVIAFIFVMLYLIFYYGVKPGLVADFALLINLFFLVGVLVAWRATLTLPGIAGIVLTMGMAVDANVLIYERIREELQSGKNMRKAVSDGFKNAISAILDSNITTLLTGIILAWFGTGPIRGFATTLIIGILTSVFTAVFVTRLVLEWMAEKDKLDDVPFTTAITKNWFQNMKIDFLGKRRIFYGISIAVVVITAVSLFARGLDGGIDFTGGRNYIVRFDQPVNTQEVEKMLEAPLENNVSVITIGTSDQVRISTNYKIDSNADNTDDEIEQILYTGLKPLIKEGVTLDMFVSGYYYDVDGKALLSADRGTSTFGIQSSQKVGPSVADDIKTSAFWAVIASLIAIGLYILIRFRDISFSIGAVLSLAHDAIFVIGAYSLLYSIMPFSLEIDQQFIAAILTVIGYSINDTVVIFDRIREIVGLYPKRDRGAVMNEAMNVTLSRTFSTLFSTLLVLILIFIFGGDVIRGFIFALLIGIAVGGYSTLFIATPIAYDVQRLRNKKLTGEKVK